MASEEEENVLFENNSTHCCSQGITVAHKNGYSETGLSTGSLTTEISKNDASTRWVPRRKHMQLSPRLSLFAFIWGPNL